LAAARLAAEGWRVTPVGTGGEALACLDQQPVDLVLAALELPDMHGLDFVQRLRRGTATFDTPVLVVSDAEVSAAALEYGAEEWVPADPQELIGPARRLLSAGGGGRGGGGPVLVRVEDGPAVRAALAQVLGRPGCVCLG